MENCGICSSGEKLRVDVGVWTAVEIDLTDFDFFGIEKVVWTVKNKFGDAPVILREFTKAGDYTVTITPEESLKLKNGALYDFSVITADGERYKNGDTGQITLRRSVGTWKDSSV
jgi:hypothetical protein|nr:MAG TPA_asm: hypothetical protein [Caudoviricetes sp.]